MRCLLKVTIPVHEGNDAIETGTIGETIESILNDLRPEASYFVEDNGHRTAFVVLDLKDPAHIPIVAEPWFLAFNARVEIHPAMTLEDLKRASSGIERVVRNYRSMGRAA